MEIAPHGSGRRTFQAVEMLYYLAFHNSCFTDVETEAVKSKKMTLTQSLSSTEGRN